VFVDDKSDAQGEMDRIQALEQHNREWEQNYRALGSPKGGDSATAAAGPGLDPELQALMDTEESERRGTAPPTPSRPADSGSSSRMDRLRQLGDLHAQGILTDAEFAQEKARILNEQ
jgi:Short C-terminal domain